MIQRMKKPKKMFQETADYNSIEKNSTRVTRDARILAALRILQLSERPTSP
jgi:hypothetical protein